MTEPPPPVLRLLIDACLTPSAVPHLERIFGDRVDSVHIDRVLPPATSDAAVLASSRHERRLLVTANSADFLALVRDGSGHEGLAFVDDQDTRERQLKSVEALTGAILGYLDLGSVLLGHVFVMRKPGRLVIRRLP